MNSAPQISLTDWIGAVAAVCTTIAFLPQLLCVWRSKSARDVSLAMLLLFSVGVFLWFVYGLRIHSPPVIAANGATLVLALAIVVLKVRYGRN